MSATATTDTQIAEPHWIAEITPHRGLFDPRLCNRTGFRGSRSLRVALEFARKAPCVGPSHRGAATPSVDAPPSGRVWGRGRHTVRTGVDG
jgi:hypothetical protein